MHIKSGDTLRLDDMSTPSVILDIGLSLTYDIFFGTKCNGFWIFVYVCVKSIVFYSPKITLLLF